MVAFSHGFQRNSTARVSAARLAGLSDANSAEFDPGSTNLVIHTMEDQAGKENTGGSRVGRRKHGRSRSAYWVESVMGFGFDDGRIDETWRKARCGCPFLHIATYRPGRRYWGKTYGYFIKASLFSIIDYSGCPGIYGDGLP